MCRYRKKLTKKVIERDGKKWVRRKSATYMKNNKTKNRKKRYEPNRQHTKKTGRYRSKREENRWLKRSKRCWVFNLDSSGALLRIGRATKSPCRLSDDAILLFIDFRISVILVRIISSNYHCRCLWYHYPFCHCCFYSYSYYPCSFHY